MTGGTSTAANRRSSVACMLNPGSVAIVGASDRPMLKLAVERNEEANVRVYLVNPNRDDLFGRPVYRSLEAVPEPMDAVISLVNADLTAAVVEDAARSGARSAIITAAGFAETDEAGSQRQAAITGIAKAHDMAICGPNCSGILNIAAGKSLAGRWENARPGRVALISHSGGLLTAALMAGAERFLGWSYLISAGNEAATDLVDYLETLTDDPAVGIVLMIIEEIRRPREFMAAAYRARAAGKPLVALKLGRSERGKRVGASHTAAMMGDARDYYAAFRQAGVLIARDIDDLLDIAHLFSGLPPDQWRDARAIGVLCASGGNAALVSDAFDDVGIALDVDDALARWTHGIVPTNAVGNPFDITGLKYNEHDFEGILERYLASPQYDTVVVVSSGLGPSQEQFNFPVIGPLRRAVQASSKRFILVSAASGSIGDWVEELLDCGVAIGRGLVPTTRSLKAMERFSDERARPQPEAPAPMPRPGNLDPVCDGDVAMLRFGDAARLAMASGLPVAPFVEVGPEDDLSVAVQALPTAEHYVVKVANALHRTEIGAVATGVQPADIPSIAARLVGVAARHSLSQDLVIQPEVHGRGELIVGAYTTSGFGPIVLVGLGGVFTEALGDVSCRVAPLQPVDADEMIRELRAWEILDGFRGGQPWHVAKITDLLLGISGLATATAGWLEAIDLNPIIVGPDGLVAVDISCVLRSPA